MVSLAQDGYLIIRNKISKEDLKFARSCFNQSKINYQNIKKVNENYLRIAGETVGKKLTCMKFRASNNNNSVDAGAFHRDYHLNPQEKNPLPVYTCLLYLDDSTMQLIPGTHQERHMSLPQAMKRFKDKKNIDVKAGDILLIYASIIHRGIFYRKQANRRLIQQFDCVDVKNLPLHMKQILHVPCVNKCYNTLADLAVKMNKIKPLSNSFNYIYYLNVAQGYVRLVNLEKKLGYPEVVGFSSEVNQARYEPKNNGWEVGNKYITNYQLQDLPASKLGKYRSYNQINTGLLVTQFILLLVLAIIIILYVICLVKESRTKKSASKSRKRQKGRK